MQTQLLRASTLLSFSLALSTAIPCQAPSAESGAADSGTALPGAQADAVAELPAFLLQVPEGDVLMGLDLQAFLAATSQAAFPYDPENAHKRAKDKFKRAMRQTVSVLGQKKVHVDTFFLGKWPVKNSEYISFIKKQRAAGVDIKAPFLLWKEGCPDDFEKHLKNIRKEFPKDSNGAIFYWERHGHELPFKLQDKKGNSVADLPVVYVSWREANKFAASIGMRLPTEAELTRAMRGDGTHAWPLGEQGPEQDKFTEKLLKDLRMSSSRDLKLKPVGTVEAAKGPYGHLDLFGQVWQLCGDLGHLPLLGVEPFEKPWKQLQKNKIGRILDVKPGWEYDKAIAKGGSYLSYQEPVQLLIDARAPMLPIDVFESLGFRLAKSLRPGYDYLYSLQRVAFNREGFAKDQDLDLTAMVGAERYTLDGKGFPTEYEAVAFAPVNWSIEAKRRTVKEMREGSHEDPVILGALACTAKLQNGCEPGLYTVSYRAAGIPRKLRDAIKRGHKEVVKARKEAEKAKKSGKDKKKDKKPKKVDKKKQDKTWQSITKRAGLTEDDLAETKAQTGDLGFVRRDGVKISTSIDQFLLSKEGKVIATLDGTKRKPTNGPDNAVSTIEALEADKQGKAVAKFMVSIPNLKRDPKKTIVFELNVLLDQAAPTADKPWRLPKKPE